MVTPIWMTGFGAQSVVAASQYQLWNVIAGDVTIDSTVLRGGRPTLKVNSTATLGARVTKVYPGTPGAVIVDKRAVRLDAAPATTQVEFFQFNPTLGYSARIGYHTGKFRARFGSGQSGVISTASWVPGTWHVIETRVNMGVSPMTMDWTIDGVAQTQLVDTGGQAASTVASTTFGPPGPDQVLLNFADVVSSATSADYPIGDSSVIPLMPDASSTAVGTSNAFEGTTDAATYTPIPTGAVDLRAYLADQPTTQTATYVRQVTAGTGNYLSVPFTDTSLTGIRAVRAILAYGTEVSGTANNAAAVVMVGSTAVSILGTTGSPVNFSAGGVGPKYADVIVPPPVGGWTLTDVNALTARLGFSTDVSPQPRWYAVMLEVDIDSSGGTTPVSQFLRPASITGSSGTWTGAVSDVSEVTPDDSTVVLSPANPTSTTYWEVKFAAGTAPGTTSGHIVRYREALRGPGPMDVTVELRNGSTVVASWTHTNISTSYVQADHVLTDAQAAACSPYSDLRLRFRPNYVPAPTGPTADLVLTRTDGRTVVADWSGSSQGDVPIATALVTWGDGNNTYTWPGTKTASHAYPATPLGNRTITVLITDTNGLTSTASAVFSVQSATPPTLDLTTTRIDENSVTLNITATAGANPLSKIDVTAWGDSTADLNLAATTTSIRHDYAATPTGFKTISVTVTDSANLTATTTTTFEVRSIVVSGNAILYAAGDIAPATSGTTDDTLASTIVNQGDATAVLTLGDNQYPDGTQATFNTYFDSSFGRFSNTLLKPQPGNHDHHTTPFAAGYRAYFTGRSMNFISQGTTTVGGVTVHKLFYTFDPHPNWRVIMLDSEIATTAAYGSADEAYSADVVQVQLDWLDTQLAALVGTNKGLIMCWHRERYSSDTTHGSYANTADMPYVFMSKAISAKCDLILNAHVHAYERFDKMNNSGAVDTTNGVRSIITGTGGNGGGTYDLGTILTGSLKRFGHGTGNDVYGATRLVLTDTQWSGSFLRSGGATASDSYGPFDIRAK